MHKKQIVRAALVLTTLAALLTPLKGYTQTSSLNTFSPYTMYGLGDLRLGGSAEIRTMGGAGVAIQNPYTFNYLNPASLSAIPRQSALFNFGGEGQNYYSKTASSSNSHNSFNFSDIGLAFPLAQGVGFGISLSSVSEVGYETAIVDDNSSVVENIGRGIYTYSGEGGISQVTGSLGVNVFKELSLGANVIYYFGSMDRFYNAKLEPMLNPTDYNEIKSFSKTHVSKVLYSLGMQYRIRVGTASSLTLGATFQPKAVIRSNENREQISIRGLMIDTIYMGKTPNHITVPTKLEGGLFYYHDGGRFTAALDYSWQDWSGSFTIPQDQNITLRSQQQIRLGASFTPHRFDLRSTFNRWTYRIGARYGTSYLTFNGQKMNDMAVSVGLGVPLSKHKVYSRISLGAEFGQRGTVNHGLIRDRYINIFAGITIFGDAEDGWFRRQKFR